MDENAITETAEEKATREAAEAAATEAAAAETNKLKPSKKVKARVLFTGAFGKVDSVVLLDAADAKAGVAAGELDTDKASVAYAESLAAPAA